MAREYQIDGKTYTQDSYGVIRDSSGSRVGTAKDSPLTGTSELVINGTSYSRKGESVYNNDKGSGVWTGKDGTSKYN